MIKVKSFSEMTNRLESIAKRKSLAVVCAYDKSTEYAISNALDRNFINAILIGDIDKVKDYSFLKKHVKHVILIDIKDPDKAAKEGVRLIRDNVADVLMKGLINTDNFLHAILNKQDGILPREKVLTHLSIVEIPSHNKLLIFSDAAVIPLPTLKQRTEMIKYAIAACSNLGIEEPRVALVHCSEKVNPKFPLTLDYEVIKEMNKTGEFGQALIDGPMDVKTACDIQSADVKGIKSSIGGNADILIFPGIEAGNTFYKTITLFAGAQTAGLLQGAECPVVLPSRSDNWHSKYYSIAMACLISE